MKVTPEQLGEIARQHLSPTDAVFVANVLLRHTQRFALLLTADGGGKSMSGPEIAAMLLRIAKRLEAEGGLSS